MFNVMICSAPVLQPLKIRFKSNDFHSPSFGESEFIGGARNVRNY
jgi:hypothetical protein